MREKTLESYRRVLPEDHPDTREGAMLCMTVGALHSARDILCDLQSKLFKILPSRTLRLDDTTKRWRFVKRRWSPIAACFQRIILI